MNSMTWLIGAGGMSKEYVKVLQSLQVDFVVIGRSEDNCVALEKEFGCKTIAGGIEDFLSHKPALPANAIVSVGIEALKDVTCRLLKAGVKNILLEKPGVAYASEIDELAQLTLESKAEVLLAYNRRFYASLLKAEELIREDMGVRSFHFEFTEWSHVISGLKKTKQEHHNWFLGNSTHVIDMAFYLGGKPAEWCAFHKGSIDWHPASAVFSGAGISDKGALFAYHADWEAPGRWGVEVLTARRRLIFRPMESLQVQQLGSVAISPEPLDDRLDKEYKPGVYLQVRHFLDGDWTRFSTIGQQKQMIDNFYKKMSGY
jgi:predicted dehydrogenase